jgi:hypothetical protein
MQMTPEPISDQDTKLDIRVDQYIAALDSPQNEVVSSVRNLIMTQFPELSEGLKWSVPTYTADKTNLLGIIAYSKYVNLYFYNGATLYDPLSLLEGSGPRVRHLAFKNPKEINEAHICELITQAIDIAGVS